MSKVVAIIIIGICLSVIGYSQNKKAENIKTRVRIVSSKPSVYITFERTGKRKPLLNGESDEGIWLRLHNNTKWAINFPAHGVPEPLGDLGMYYQIVSTKKIIHKKYLLAMN